MLRLFTPIACLLMSFVSKSSPDAVSPNHAASLLDAMNSSIDPCNDFYQYACGGWIAKNPDPGIQGFWDRTSILQQQISPQLSSILSESNNPNDPIPVNKARDFYAACMNLKSRDEIGLGHLLDIFKSFGGWPMTLESASDFKDENFNWQKLMATSTRLYDHGPLLTISITTDVKDTSRNQIYIGQGFYQVNLKSENILAAYEHYIIGAAKEMRKEMNLPVDDDTLIKDDVAAMLQFEIKLHNISTPPANDTSRKHNPISVAELQKFTDAARSANNKDNKRTCINWLELLNDIFYLGASIKITESETVVIRDKDYLMKLIALLNETPSRTIANYLHWRIVYNLFGVTTKSMMNLMFEYNKIVSGITQEFPMSEMCAYFVNYHFNLAIGHKYILSILDSRAKNEVKKIATHLKIAFESLVENANWINSTAIKTKAKEKLDEMVVNVGYPDSMTEKNAFVSYFNDLSISRRDFLASYLSALKFEKMQFFKSLRQPKNPNSWDVDAASINAYASNNKITIPANMCQPPFFMHGRLAVLNYGAIGTIIGHEIIHNFDTEARYIDKNGKMQHWWDNDVVSENVYRSQVKCFTEQYSNYTLADETPLDGVRTLDENIADNSGVRAAFLAYKNYVKEGIEGSEQKLPGLEHMSSEQLFFLSYANNWCSSSTIEYLRNLIKSKPHAPDNFRVIGSLSNNPDFVRAFNCPAGSRMNRIKKCSLW